MSVAILVVCEIFDTHDSLDRKVEMRDHYIANSMIRFNEPANLLSDALSVL